jgi:hypothetical protein
MYWQPFLLFLSTGWKEPSCIYWKPPTWNCIVTSSDHWWHWEEVGRGVWNRFLTIPGTFSYGCWEMHLSNYLSISFWSWLNVSRGQRFLSQLMFGQFWHSLTMHSNIFTSFKWHKNLQVEMGVSSWPSFSSWSCTISLLIMFTSEVWCHEDECVICEMLRAK